MAAYRTQVLLPQDKITEEVVQDLQLAPIKPDCYNSIELVDRLLIANCTLPKLKELRVQACNEKKSVWQLQDGLLLRDGKLYVLNGQLTSEISLRTTLIKEVHE
ncbi:hypothetical protein GP486_006621 [Trichoglossum hirsutum]|uniref:Uncharacterized protein n=1 Tax=Trichoglossum hirsutum TaxID=265104 RepID=A0A9P8IGN5_9PEZI|nr:hypothetical protein GP486_006621 [Trichoglossum hirsutum]